MHEQSSLFAKIVESAFRLKYWLLFVFISVMAVTIGVTLASKKQYASSMQLIVRDAREKPLVAADKGLPQSAPDSSQELVESHAEAEFEMLSADDILERAVLYRAKVLPSAPNPAPGSAEMAKEMQKMQGRLKVIPIKKTPVIEVSYRDASPEAAQKVLGEIQRADLEKHLKVLRPSGTTQVFSDLAHNYNDRLAKAEKDLSAFQIKNSLLSLPDEEASLSRDRDATRSALLAEQANLSSGKAQVAALQIALARTPERIPTTARESSNSYSIQQVTGVLVDLTNRRTQILTRYQPTDRLVTELDKQIADTNARLQSLKSEPSYERDSDNNPIFLQTQQQLAAANIAVAASQVRAKTLSAQLDQIGQRMKHLADISGDNDRLARNVEELKESQRLYADRLNSELVEDILDKDKLGNIAVAMEPTFSRHAVSPRVPLNIALGLLTAVALCGMLLFIIEANRSTFHSPAELTSGTGIPVLAAVPAVNTRLLMRDMVLASDGPFLATAPDRGAHHKGDTDGHNA